ncbi:MAG: hypothetical protein ACOC80_09180 [Petrotogales bacterium]
MESYRLNSKVRMTQFYDKENEIVNLFIHGQVEGGDQVIQELQRYGIKVKISTFSTEKDMVVATFDYLKSKGKTLVGHNLSHFDIGLLEQKKQKYKVEGFKFQMIPIGAENSRKRHAFTYTLEDDKEKDFDQRRRVIDTMFIAFNTGLEGNLKYLSKKFSPYPKRDFDVSEFRDYIIRKDALLYSIYDVISLPYIYKGLRKIIEDVSVNHMIVPKKASTLCYEHLWQKSAGQLAECWLNNVVGRRSIDLPDFCNKYLGGLTFTWQPGITFADNRQIRQFDLASAYPMAAMKMGILDILAGNFEDCSGYTNVSEIYDELIDASTILVRAKNPMQVLKIEIEREKDQSKDGEWKPGITFGVGFIKNFDKNNKVADTQRDFAFIKTVKRGETVLLTKTELEMNNADDPDFFKKWEFVRVFNGFRATKYDKSKDIEELYKLRDRLKSEKNPAEKGFKTVLVSLYGKLADIHSDYYVSALAASITGFVRRQIYELVAYAEKIGIEPLYSDTDSLYCKGTSEQFDKLLNHANKINDVAKTVFGKNNLDDEGETIHLFKATKRKRYVKVFDDDKTGERLVTIKGGGHTNLNWRHYLFELCYITGQYSIEEINESINNLDFNPLGKKFDFEKFESFLRELYDNYKDQDLRILISPLYGCKKKSPITLGKKISLKYRVSYPQGTEYHYSIKEWQDEVWRRDLKEYGFVGEFGETILDDYRQIKEYIDDLKHESKLIDRSRKSKWQEFYDLLKDNMDEGFEWFADEETILRSYAYYFRQLAKRLGIKPDLTNSDFYLNIYESLYDYDLLDLINKISPLSEQVIDVGDDEVQLRYIHSQTEELEAKKEELEERLKRIEKTIPKEKPYTGLFFDLFRVKGKYYFDATQLENYIEDSDFSLSYEMYVTPPNNIPAMYASTYNEILFQPLEIDTLTFIQKSAINLYQFQKEDSKKITNSVFNAKHSGIDNANAPNTLKKSFASHKCLLFKMRLEDNNGRMNLTLLRDIMEDDEARKTYYNSAMHVNNIGSFQGSFRVHKWRLIDNNPTIFSLVYKGSQIQNLAQKWLENRMKANGVDMNLPMFSMVYQVDVSQETTEEKAKELWMNSWNKPYPVTTHGTQMMHDFKTYFSLNTYNKAASARKKIEKQNMTEEEKDNFLEEAKEGWRSEIKFQLQRPLSQVASYAYILNQIDKSQFIDFAKNSDNIYSKKEFKVDLDARGLIEGLYGFGERRVYVLFIPELLVMLNSQEQLREGLTHPLDFLEKHGAIVDGPFLSTCFYKSTDPPQQGKFIKSMRKGKVKWFLENSKEEIELTKQEDKSIDKEIYKYEVLKNGSSLPWMNNV